MTPREMHYDFKQKLNKIDSQQYRNLLVPEIDWKLNEAQEVYVKMIANPRSQPAKLGFEINQRTIDDIRTIVVDQVLSNGIVPTVYDTTSYIAILPADYWHLLSSKVYATKGACLNVKLKTTQVQHDDEHDLSPFDRSSFEWRKSNIWFNKEGIRIFTDGTYSITKIVLSYLIQPRRIHNAQDYQGGTYIPLDGGVPLVGSQACELPVMLHREIVDLAVLITAGDLSLPDYSLKQKKVQMVSN